MTSTNYSSHLRTASEQTVIAFCQAERERLLGEYPEFVERLDDVDYYICSPSEMVELIDRAPIEAARQCVFEIFGFRQTLHHITGRSFALTGGAFPVEREEQILGECDGERMRLLAEHPDFEALLDDVDHHICPRDELVELMRQAPTAILMQCLFEVFSYRDMLAKITGRSFF